MLVLPWPLSPLMTLNRGESRRSACARHRTCRMKSDSMRSAFRSPRGLNAHRHHDRLVASLVALRGRPQHRGIEIPADAENHLVVVHRAEHVEEVSRVEADDDVVAVVFDRQL